LLAGAEEMNSLSKRPKKGPAERENAFRLHYFPEIPVDFSTRNRSQPTGESAFNRIDFENTNKTLADLTDDSLAGDKNYPAGSNQKIEEIEAQAYLRGFNKGEKAGFKTGQEKLELLSAVLRILIIILNTFSWTVIFPLLPFSAVTFGFNLFTQGILTTISPIVRILSGRCPLLCWLLV